MEVGETFMPVKTYRRSRGGPPPDVSDAGGDYADDFRDLEPDDRLAEAADKVEAENVKLRRENERLRREAPKPQQPQQTPKSSTPESKEGAFLLIVPFIMGGRLALYALVEDWGTRSGNVGIVADIAFGILALIVVGVWLRATWQAQRILMVPS